MKNPTIYRVAGGAALFVLLALHGNAALIAYEDFDYTGGVSLTTETTNGGFGWSDAWAGTGISGVTGLTTSGTGESLWFGQSPVLIPDGSTHAFTQTNSGNRRNLGTTVNLSNSTLFLTTLFHVYEGADVVDMRAEFFDGLNAGGNMRGNVGISDGDLFVSAANSGYKPAGNSTVASDLVAGNTTYLLAMKRVGGSIAGVSGIYASLIPASGNLNMLDEEPAWQVFHAGFTGVTFQSFRLIANGTGGGIRVDELRIATDWDNAVAGLIPEPSAALLAGLGMLALLRRRR